MSPLHSRGETYRFWLGSRRRLCRHRLRRRCRRCHTRPWIHNRDNNFSFHMMGYAHMGHYLGSIKFWWPWPYYQGHQPSFWSLAYLQRRGKNMLWNVFISCNNMLNSLLDVSSFGDLDLINKVTRGNYGDLVLIINVTRGHFVLWLVCTIEGRICFGMFLFLVIKC